MGSRVVFAITDVQAEVIRGIAAGRELNGDRYRRAFYALRSRQITKGSFWRYSSGDLPALTPLGKAAAALLERLAKSGATNSSTGESP